MTPSPKPAARDFTGDRAALGLVGSSAFIRRMQWYLPKVAVSDCNVLITGETGTGKELIAQALHFMSARGSRPFIAVNCAALPETLLESELFGHERGAFTNAIAAQPGKFEQARDGTIFLDEIGEMSLLAQAKLLRVLETRETQRLGAARATRLEARVVTATNQEAERLMEEGRFRADLFFRLNVVRIHIPPLRERPEDIPPLLEHFLARCAARLNASHAGFAPETLSLLLRYSWPGNAREVRNLVEALFVSGLDRPVEVCDLPDHLRRTALGAGTDERRQLLETLQAVNWNKSRAARALHWSRMTVYRKMNRFGLSR